MFDYTSRYYEVEDRHYEDPDGKTIAYKARRMLPRPVDRSLLFEVEVQQSDRPDLLASRALQDPALFWQLCEANEVMHPFELTERSGRRVRVLIPGL